MIKNKKNFEDEKLTHELFLTTRQSTKIRNPFANNMSTDIKPSKAEIPKMIQSDGFLCNMLGNLDKKVITDLVNILARDSLPGPVSNLASNTINKSERKISGKGALRAGKIFSLFISNEYMNDITKIIKSLQDLGVLIDAVTETVKHEIKKTKRWISWSFVSIFSLFNSATSDFFSSKRYMWKRMRRPEKRYIDFSSAPSLEIYIP